MSPRADERLLVNDERTVLVRVFKTGHVEVALRRDPDDIWGPPIVVQEEASDVPTPIPGQLDLVEAGEQ